MQVLASTTEAGMTRGRLNQTVYLSTSVQDFHKKSKGRRLVTSEEAIPVADRCKRLSRKPVRYSRVTMHSAITSLRLD